MFKKFIFCFFCFCCFQAFTIPKGKNVVSGEARDSYKVDQNLLKISTSDKAIINWDSFSIENFEKVVFEMPNQNSAVLNRVVGRLKSSILGSLQANGNVFLINPQGVLIGKDACINVNSFLASTFDVLNEKFLNNGDMLFSGDSKEKIINLGTIKASDGDVILLGRIVENKGVLEAKNGDVCIGVGKEILLKPMDKERIYIKPVLEDEKEDVGIENSGEILAKNVEMKADGNLYSLAIKNSGSVDAYSLVERDGRILLEAKDGRVETDGSLVAKKENGGEIHVLGKEVGLLDKAFLDASSDTDGGEILIGGDYKGENENIYNAKAVVVFSDAVIKANAGLEGDGGKIIFWADDYMDFHGSAFAKGGEIQGDGGFIEISSKGYWNCLGVLNANSFNGKMGQILFDPDELSITNTTPTTDSKTVFPPTYTPKTYPANLHNTFLESVLLGNLDTTVTVTSTGDITLKNAVTSKGNLTLSAPNGTILFREKYTITADVGKIFHCNLIAKNILIDAVGTDVGIDAKGENTITINSEVVKADSLSIFGSTSTTSKAFIQSSQGLVKINVNELQMFSNKGEAFIKTNSGGHIEINENSIGSGSFTIESSSVPVISAPASIRTDGGGDIVCNFLGNGLIKANGTASGGFAGIFSGYTSGNGNIEVLCKNLTIESGDFTNSIAGIFSGYGGGSGIILLSANVLSITSNEAIAGILAPVAGGNIAGSVNSMNLTSNNAEVAIRAANGEINITNVGALTMSALGSYNCDISSSDSLNMQGVDSITMNPVGKDTFIRTTGVNKDININSLNNPGSGGIKLNPSGSNFASYIETVNGGDIDVHFSGISSFTAGNSDCGIFTGRNVNAGNIRFSSGALTVRGASGGASAWAGIFSELGGPGSGDVTFNVGALSLIGGTDGIASISSAFGDIKNSSADSISLTSNEYLAAIVAELENVGITNAGDVSLTALKTADCYIRGKKSLNMQGVDSITMLPTGSDTYITTDSLNANLTINSIGSRGVGGITLNQAGTGTYASYIATEAGGNINIYFSGDSYFRGGNNASQISGIFSGRLSGTGNIDFYSGDLTIQGGTGSNSFAGIHSKGNLTFQVDDLRSIGGSGGKANIFADGGNIEPSSATYIYLVSNAKEASIIAPSGSIAITSAGDVVMTADGTSCRIECQDFLDMQGVKSLGMYPTSNSVFIKTTGTNYPIQINSLDNPGSSGIYLNPSGNNYASYIETDQGGDIDVHFSGPSSFTAGTFNSGIFSGWTSGNGYINFSSGDLTITGGTGSGTSLAGIFSGYESGAFTGSGNILMNISGDLDLQAGSGTSGLPNRHNAEVRAGSGGGSVLVNATGDVNLLGGSGGDCSSYIQATSSLVDITANKILLNSHASSSTSEAAIKTASGIVSITTDSDVYVKANAAPAYIDKLNTMYCGNDLILESNNEEAYINAVTGSTPIIDVADDLKLIAIGANAKINVLSPDVLFNIGEDLILSAQNSTGAFGAFIDGTDATFNVGRNIELFGNDNTFAGFAEISFTNNISVNAGRVELCGGDSIVAGAFTAIESSGGNLNLTTNFGGVELIGGRKATSYAALEAAGVMNLYVQGTLDMQATQDGESYIAANSFSGFFVNRTISMLGSDNNAYIIGSSGALNVTAGENIYLNGNARVENSTGPLSLIAGNNMYIRNLSIIRNIGDEDVTLVVDNDYPVSPERGHGHFIFDGNSIIEDGKVRIFTVERDFDTISGTINGVLYVPGPEFEDSNQERWGVYYPDSFFGGPGFTIFYKNHGDSHHGKGLEYVAFASAELFYRLNNMKVDFDILDLYDRYIKRSKKYLVDYLYDNRKNEKKKLSELNLR
jgi:filamentous hemagglutinin family protein